MKPKFTNSLTGIKKLIYRGFLLALVGMVFMGCEKEEFENFEQTDSNNQLRNNVRILPMTVHYVETTVDYYKNFSQIPVDVSPRLFLVNKVIGGIVGGFSSAIISSVWAEIDGTRASGESYGKAFAQGFIGGAITSL